MAGILRPGAKILILMMAKQLQKSVFFALLYLNSLRPTRSLRLKIYWKKSRCPLWLNYCDSSATRFSTRARIS
jgi:hypothetical protein